MNAQRDLSFLTDREELFEATLFIDGTKAKHTFGVTLDLEHLNQRLKLLTKAPVIAGVGNAINRFAGEGQAPTLVRIVGNRQKLTALAARRIQLFPEINLRAGVIGRDGVVGRNTRAEDHVAVVLTPIDHGRGVLVGSKGGEDTGVIVPLSRRFYCLPCIQVILTLHRFVIAKITEVFDQGPVFNIGS